MTITDRLQEDYQTVKNMGYEVVGIFLQGSQNYGLDYEDSDIDTKAIVVPKFTDFVLNAKPASFTHVLPSNEHIDIKDIRLMFDCFKKQNINFIEILFTKYMMLNPKYETLFMPLIENNEMIARYNNYAAINCIAGMSMEKYKALEHPYPATMDKIEKFGYDPKQLHHILRLYDFISGYINNQPYADCLMPTNAEYLIDVKRGIHNLIEARYFAYRRNTKIKDIKDEYIRTHSLEINTDVEELLNKVLVDIMKFNFQIELIGGING